MAGILGAVEVQPRALYTRAGAFSGGNQQKIAIGKWLLAGSRILLMFDPTRGVDIGTKHQLYLLMRRFADAGGAILFHSTEIAELVNLCDRVQVLYGGRVAAGARGRRDRGRGDHARGPGRDRARPGHARHERRRAADARAAAPRRLRLGRHRGLLVACAVFVLLFALADAITPGSFSYFELSFMSSGGATLALAAMGQTIVILTGGFDLSAGAVVSLVNVVLGTWMGTDAVEPGPVRRASRSASAASWSGW